MDILKIAFLLLAVLAAAIFVGCREDQLTQHQLDQIHMSQSPAPIPEVSAGREVITLGAGCFWCVEAVFQQIPGVEAVTSGYMGGKVDHPTYEQVCDGNTGHAEVTRVIFDPAKTSLEKILTVFWHAHDPTTLNRQGGDVGTQYRSAIYFENDAQKQVAEKSKASAQAEFRQSIVTEITAASTFYAAENYHQNYYRLNKNRNPYCQMVIRPKLGKLGLEQ